MDTSKFSLEKTYATINPVKDYLSFRPLSACFQEKRMFGSTLCGLMIWPRHVMTPLILTERSMVYPVLSVKRDFEKPHVAQAKRFSDGVLLCHQDPNQFKWLFMQTDYVSQGGCSFWSERTKIFPVDDGNFQKMVVPPHGFGEKLVESIREWICLSMDRREKAVEGLRSLNRALLRHGVEAVKA